MHPGKMLGGLSALLGLLLCGSGVWASGLFFLAVSGICFLWAMKGERE